MIDNAIASLAVRDVTTAAEWYRRLLGRQADAAPRNELVEWKFQGGGWLQVYQAPDRAGSGSCTLTVTDLAGEISRLKGAGLKTSDPSEMAAMKVMMIKDPDGNSIALVETRDPNVEP